MEITLEEAGRISDDMSRLRGAASLAEHYQKEAEKELRHANARLTTFQALIDEIDAALPATPGIRIERIRVLIERIAELEADRAESKSDDEASHWRTQYFSLATGIVGDTKTIPCHEEVCKKLFQLLQQKGRAETAERELARLQVLLLKSENEPNEDLVRYKAQLKQSEHDGALCPECGGTRNVKRMMGTVEFACPVCCPDVTP